MRIKLSFVLIFSIVMSIFMSVPSIAVTTNNNTKLTAAELAVAKAYVSYLETGNEKEFAKIKYPGAKFNKPIAWGNYMNVKLINPTYTKAYDSKAKLYTINIKCLLVYSSTRKIAIYNLTTGVYLKTQKSKIYAFKENLTNAALDFSFFEVLNATQKKLVSDYLKGLYKEDTANYILTGKSDDQATSKMKGSINSPVPMNETFTWTDVENMYGDILTGSYSLTVKKTEPITRDEIEKAGLKRPKDADFIDYIIVTVKWEVKSAKLVPVTAKGLCLKPAVVPYACSTATLDRGTDFDSYIVNFKGSIAEAAQKTIGVGKEYCFGGDTFSYSAEGKIIVPVYNDEGANFLVVNNGEDSIYGKRSIHFELD